MNRSKQLSAWIMVLVALLAACQSTTVEETPAPIAEATETRLATTVPATSTASPTAVPTDTPVPTHTATASPTTQPTQTSPPTPSSTPPATATSSPTPRPNPRELGFHPVDFAGFPVQSLWIAPSGRLWIDSDAGLWEYTEEQIFRPRTQTLDVQIVGADGNGRVWALFDEGETIAYHLSGGEWMRFGSEAGWDPAPNIEFGGEIATDGEGNVWLALGRAGLRRFDPDANRWRTLRATETGFEPPPDEEGGVTYDPRLAFSDVLVDNFGNVWAAACAVQMMDPEGPFPVLLGQGQGARWFNGSEWAGSAQIGDRCVRDMALDENGRVWLAGPQNEMWAGENELVRYDPDGGVWEFIPLPAASDMFRDRPRFGRAVAVNETGRLWLFVARRGGASFPPDGVYYREGEAWELFLEMLPGSMAFGPGDTVWVWIEPGYPTQSDPVGLARYRGGTWQEYPYPWPSPAAELAVDGNGRLWFYQHGDRWTLWYYDAP